MSSARRYDIVLLGATGYTGKLTAEYITESFPTNIKWAIAGRSEPKLRELNAELSKINSSRPTPDILTLNLSPPELTSLARKSRLIINTVGPYHLYSTPVVQACAEQGTHYLDVTGETPWVHEIIRKFEATAKKSGAVLIPEIGVESAPSDVLAYVATRVCRQVWDCGVMDVIASIHELKSSGPSGGTLATILGLMDHYSLKQVRETLANPFCISTINDRDIKPKKYPEPSTYRRSLLQKLSGVWSYPLLGTLATSITGSTNNALVHRTSGLNPLFYGFNFTYEEYMRVSSPFLGFLIHIAIGFASLLLIIPPVRRVLKTLVTQPGFGPTKDSGTKDRIELRCVALAEQLSKSQRKSYASFSFEGSMYVLTAITLAEGALSLLAQEKELKEKYGNGAFLTPACLGDHYVEGLKRAGIQIEARQLGDNGTK